MTIVSPDFLALQNALAGEYSLERELGRGGMGIVYLARDVQLDRPVAIKVLPQHLAEQPESRDRFMREARTAAGLSHPHIVPIHRVGEAGAFVFFVMTYVAGQTLGERLRDKGPLGAADATRLLREVAWALAYAHGRGIVHRDVKPDNIVIEEETGRALVMDFGIARTDAATSSTAVGKIMGTAQFMSPEQATSEAVDGRSDLYSLGVVGYLAVSGRLPFEASNIPALLLKQVTEIPQRVDTVAPGVPPMLAAAIERCLEKDPSARFSDGEELAAALVPPASDRPVLPYALRSWLTSRDPARVPYAMWSVFTAGVAANNYFSYSPNLRGVFILVALAFAPLVPAVIYQAAHARRLFRAGFTINDLRSALDFARSEREQPETHEQHNHSPAAVIALRALTWGSVGTAIGVSFFPDTVASLFHLTRWTYAMTMGFLPFEAIMVAAFATIASVVFVVTGLREDISVLPAAIHKVFRVPIRDRFWNSRIANWLARRLGAPSTSRAVGANLFRVTEVALSAALEDLYCALPHAFREHLAELPGIVSALEQRASAARRDIDLLDAQPKAGDAVNALRQQRRVTAKSRLGATVAALEGIRLDLLRLHAGSTDLAPLTTVLDAAKRLAEDVERLSAAQREVSLLSSPETERGAARIPTPA